MSTASSIFDNRDEGVDSPVETSGNQILSTGNQFKRPKFNRDSTTAIGPLYTVASISWQNRLDMITSYTSSSTTEEGQRFIEILSQLVISTDARQGMTVMIPADVQEENELLNGDWGATSNFIFALVQEKPTMMTVRVEVIGYLHTPAEIQLECGEHLVFKTLTHFLTPLGINEVAVKTIMAARELRTSASTIVNDTGKSGVSEKAKLSGQYCVLDLNGVMRPCSGKSEGVKRMSKVNRMIRLLGWKRFEKLVLDLDYNPKYFMSNCQRYEESAGDLPFESPFKSLGKLSHISDLPVFINKQKLDCVLLGTYPQYDRTVICLGDFLRTESKTVKWKREASRQGRITLGDALRNIEKVFEVFYGVPYKNCFNPILVALEDEGDVFDDYDDLYIAIQLEIIISKFYSDIRYERVPVVFPEMTMETPELCAMLLDRHLHFGLTQARGTAITGNWEKQPHSKFYSSEGTYKKILVTVTPPTAPVAKKVITAETVLICPYHLAGQLGILSASGSVIKCTADRCKNKHESIDKLLRNDVTIAARTIVVKRMRELCMMAIQKYYKK